jgi:hypothetical protein
MEERIIKWLEKQMMFGDNILPHETALQLIFTNWHESSKDYDGKEEDRNRILLNALCLEDVIDILIDNDDWNFQKTEFWKQLYCR